MTINPQRGLTVANEKCRKHFVWVPGLCTFYVRNKNQTRVMSILYSADLSRSYNQDRRVALAYKFTEPAGFSFFSPKTRNVRNPHSILLKLSIHGVESFTETSAWVFTVGCCSIAFSPDRSEDGQIIKLKLANKSSQGSLTREMEDSGADLISELLDALLLHIFSFLDETVVIQSSVLSRRWRYLWTLIPFPEHVKQKRSYFKTQKIEIREEKLRLEEAAQNSVSRVSIDVVKSIAKYFLLSLPISMLPGFQIFRGFHLSFTVTHMKNIYISLCNSCSRLECSAEADMKRLQERDSGLTSAVNSYSTSKPMMELLFPNNFQPRYAKTAKLYGILGMLLAIIISYTVAALRWKIEFILETGESKRIVHGLS